jgi:hypothetical protein
MALDEFLFYPKHRLSFPGRAMRVPLPTIE